MKAQMETQKIFELQMGYEPTTLRDLDGCSNHSATRDSMVSRVGAVVRVLAFHQCVPGSIPALGVICGLSMLVLYSVPRGFSPGTPVFPSPQNQHLI